MILREATLADVPELVAMGQRFLASSGYSTLLAENALQMESTATALITGASSVVWVAEGAGGDLIGMLGLICFVHPMSGEATCGETFWYAEQAGAGLRLLERGKQWARDQHAVAFQMIEPASEPRLAALYVRQGFKRVEVAWQLDLEAA